MNYIAARNKGTEVAEYAAAKSAGESTNSLQGGGRMSRIERIREFVKDAHSREYFTEKEQAGWRLVAVEWEREGAETKRETGKLEVEIPYGLRVSAAGQRLEEDPSEKEILLTMMDCIVRDLSIGNIAAELNRKNYRTRQGIAWGVIAVFDMLPRLIEIGPQIFPSDEWAERRRHLMRLASGSGEGAGV
jgi:hypothetical protein